jgi:hypothetical protein
VVKYATLWAMFERIEESLELEARFAKLGIHYHFYTQRQ